jgi:hypothetical protein
MKLQRNNQASLATNGKPFQSRAIAPFDGTRDQVARTMRDGG